MTISIDSKTKEFINGLVEPYEVGKPVLAHFFLRKRIEPAYTVPFEIEDFARIGYGTVMKSESDKEKLLELREMGTFPIAVQSPVFMEECTMYITNRAPYEHPSFHINARYWPDNKNQGLCSAVRPYDGVYIEDATKKSTKRLINSARMKLKLLKAKDIFFKEDSQSYKINSLENYVQYLESFRKDLLKR